jgi:hypothetical protein
VGDTPSVHENDNRIHLEVPVPVRYEVSGTA